MRFIALLTAACLLAMPALAQTAAQALADKSDQVVIFYDDQGREMGRFAATFGQAPGAKLREGDLKTPEGDYMLSPARPSVDWDWFMPIDYPNANDLMRARAARQSLKNMGGQIGLHSTGKKFMHRVRQGFGENWTLGCIAVADSHMTRIRSLVTRPIPIRIQP
jgi:murein L,D-transpeptidase YafK